MDFHGLCPQTQNMLGGIQPVYVDPLKHLPQCSPRPLSQVRMEGFLESRCDEEGFHGTWLLGTEL